MWGEKHAAPTARPSAAVGRGATAALCVNKCGRVHGREHRPGYFESDRKGWGGECGENKLNDDQSTLPACVDDQAVQRLLRRPQTRRRDGLLALAATLSPGSCSAPRRQPAVQALDAGWAPQEQVLLFIALLGDVGCIRWNEWGSPSGN